MRIGLFDSGVGGLTVLKTLINKFNKLGGIIYGFAKGLLIVFAILAIIGLFSPILGTAFMQGLDNSILGSLMYKYNLFLIII